MKKQVISFVLFIFIAHQWSLSQNFECRVDTFYHYKNYIGTNFMNLYSRTIYTYNENNLETQRRVELFILATNSFQNSSLENRTYNSEGKITEEASFNWNTNTNAWVGGQKLTYAYSESAPQTISTRFYWIQSDNTWSQNERNELHILSPTERFTVRKFAGQNGWVNNSKNTRWLNASGLVESQIIELWNTQNNVWVNDSKYSFTYNSADNFTSTLIEKWENEAWINGTLISYTYNSQNQNLQTLNQKWNVPLNTWINDYRWVNTYNNDTQVSLSQSWEVALSFWTNEYRSTYTYDEFDNQIELLQEYWVDSTNTFAKQYYRLDFFDENNFQYLSKYWSMWNEATESYDNHTINEFVCSAIEVLGFEEADAEEITIYPNPISNGQNINISSSKQSGYHIINMLGEVVLSGKLEAGKNEIDTSDLKSGVYIIKLENSTHKIIIH